jgi:hypothetical protein
MFERDHSGVARSKLSPLIPQINKKGGGRRLARRGNRFSEGLSFKN